MFRFKSRMRRRSVTLKRFLGGSLFVFVLAGTGLAQQNRAPINNPQEAVTAAPLVKATATAKRVRFVSPGTVVQLRLEVYNEAGQKLFDTELNGGNVLDWYLQDGAGQDLQAGSYACVMTIKSLSGRLSQRVGLVTVNDKKAAIEAAEGAQLSLAQQQAIGPVEGNAALTILQESEAEAITAVTHDGAEGQLTSTKGALTFRTGDIFSGKDKEQMRLTEDGRLGIGTSDPQAKLDVAGPIRAQRFLIAKPKAAGADKTEILEADATATDSADVEALAAGTGTQNRIAKWVDNAGTLGDSVIAESAGNIGIGTTSATHKLDVQNTGANGAIRSVNETFGVRGLISEQHSSNVVGAIFVGLKSRGTLAAPTAVVPNDFGAFFSNKWYDGTSYVQSGAFGFTVDGPVSNGVVPTRLSFVTSSTSGDGPTAHGVERMTILSGGNVGIGTATPAFKLEVTDASNTGLRVGTGATGGTVASFGGNGDFQIDAPNVAGGRFTVKEGGRVGIGTNSPLAALDLKGGAEGDGSHDPVAMAFQWRGGGYRHWIRTRHIRGYGSGNAIDFFVNNSAAPTGSTAPGVGNVHVMTLDNGNVGVGTTAPTFKLHVEDASNTGLRVGTGAEGGTVASFGGNGDFRVDRPGVEGGRFIIKEGGNVGIGESAPTFKLDVTDASNKGLRVGTVTPGGTIASFGSNGDFRVDRPAVEGGRFIIKEHGNVGIGESAPQAKLDIVGGADSNGAGDLKAIALSHREGGYRHWIRTRHNVGAVAGNAIDFFVNNSSVRLDSSAPGVGNVHVMTLDNGNVGIGTISPGAKFQVAGGDAAISTQGNGLILRATDGPLCYRLTVNHGGMLSTAVVSCPP